MLSKHLINRAKRSSIVLMTNEARVLKELRGAVGLSMRQAGKLIDKSDSYISHIENGRMDVPKKEKLEEILNIYGNIKPKSFYERARKIGKRQNCRQDLSDWVLKAPDSDIIFVYRLVTGVFSQR